MSAALLEADECGCPPDRGHGHARLFTPPLRPLTPQTTDGYRAIQFAVMLGLGLLPWQKWALLHALELNPDGTFRFKTVVLMVARQQGKTTLAVLIMLYWLVILERKLIVNSAQDLATAEESWDSLIEMFRENELLAGQMIHEPIMAAGKKALVLTGGRRAIPKASNRKAGRGLSIDDLFMDELREQRTWDAYDALSSATIARPNSQILGASNAGDIESIVLAYLRDAALADIKEGTNSGVCLLEWSADEKDDPGAVETWRQSCPGLGYTIDVADLRAKYATMPIASFRTEFLTQFVARMNAPVDLVAWEGTSDAKGDLRHVFKRGDLHMGVEVSHDGQHVTLAGAGIDTADADRVRVRTGIIKSWAGPTAVVECERELKEIIDKARPRTLVWYPTGPGSVLKVAISKIRSTKVVAYRGPDIPSACMSFSEQVSARAVLNDGSALMATQILAAKWVSAGDGVRFEVKGIGAHVDGLYASAGAIQQARLAGARKRGAIVAEPDPTEGAPQ